MLAEAARPARQSPFMLPSTVSCEAVAAWTVVMTPSLIGASGLVDILIAGAYEVVSIEAAESIVLC